MPNMIKYMSKITRNIIFSKSTKNNAKNNTWFGVGGLGYRGGALGHHGEWNETVITPHPCLDDYGMCSRTYFLRFALTGKMSHQICKLEESLGPKQFP